MGFLVATDADGAAATTLHRGLVQGAQRLDAIGQISGPCMILLRLGYSSCKGMRKHEHECE